MLKFQAVAEKTAKDARGYFILLHLVDTDGNYVTKTEKQYLLHFTASNSQKNATSTQYVTILLTRHCTIPVANTSTLCVQLSSTITTRANNETNKQI